MVEIKDWIQVFDLALYLFHESGPRKDLFLDFHHFDAKNRHQQRKRPKTTKNKFFPIHPPPPLSLSLSLMKSSYFSGKIHI
jgi:hypothetical protein